MNPVRKSTKTVFILALAFMGGFLIFYNPKPASSPAQENSLASDTQQKWESNSVELDQDIVTVVVLVDDSGKEYSPVRWEGAPVGGHHREGVLIFNPIMPAPSSVELKITGIADIIRTFTWQLP